MKLGKLIIEFRRAGGVQLVEEVFDAITDPEGEARALIAKMARSAAKDFIQLYEQRIVEEVSAELEKRKTVILAELGSANPPALPSPIVKELRRAISRLERDHCQVLYTLPADKVCWNAMCATQERVPHMLDERDHRPLRQVVKELDK